MYIFIFYGRNSPVCNILSSFLLCWVMTLPCMFFLRSFCFWASLRPLGGTGNTAGWLPQLCWNPIYGTALSLLLALGYCIPPPLHHKSHQPLHPQLSPSPKKSISIFLFCFHLYKIDFSSLLYITTKYRSPFLSLIIIISLCYISCVILLFFPSHQG